VEKLPKRLKAVAAKVPPGKTVADIGTDHAMLPIYLVQSGISPRVIATDINKGPFQKAKAVVRLQGLEDHIDIRLGNGLSVFQPGEAEVVVISGLGGFTIVDIFEQSPDILPKVETLVLSPATHEGEVRKWLTRNNWIITDEDLVKDQDRIYQIIVAEQNKALTDCRLTNLKQLTNLEYEIGPINIGEKHPLLKEYLGVKLQKYEKAIEGLQNSESAKSAAKIERLLVSIEEIRGLIQLLDEGRED